MEYETNPEQQPDIDPELLEDAMAVLASAGCEHLADVVIAKGGQKDTVLRGLAPRLDMLAEAGFTDVQVREYVEKLVGDHRVDPG